ncbi:uncharacterized protein [Palaemon carinicauda]|uniref:uncharacterized protein n=1 Tax=Palaemon carinicauda TaxID=392227 RepID=UPI0035B580AB
MDLGQRIYPEGCSRVVCKIILGRPIIEHQFCEKIKVPKHCIAQERSWKRYPDCCPEVVCPPAHQGYQGRLDTRLYQQGPTAPGFYYPSSVPGSYANGNGALFHGVASKQNQRPSDVNDFFTTQNPLRGTTDVIAIPGNGGLFHGYTSKQNQRPSDINYFFATENPLRGTTDVVYGQGFSSPYIDTTSVKVSRDPELFLIEDNRYPADFWEPKEQHYLVSPTNGLDLFGQDYQEVSGTQDLWNTGFDSGEPNEYADFWETSTTKPARATPFVISHQHSPVDDLTKSSYSFYKDAHEVNTSPLPYREQNLATPTVIEHQNTPQTRMPGRRRYKKKPTTKSEDESVTETTEVPVVRPMTHAPHTNLGSRYKPTSPLHQLRTHSSLPVSSLPITTKTTSATTEAPTTIEMRISTFPTTQIPETTKQEISTTSKKDLFLTSDKNLKDSFSQPEMQPAIEEDISDDTAPSKIFTRLPPVRKPTTTPFERITKRVRTSSTPKKRLRVRKTTVAPTTTPPSYEFVSPELDPEDHDLVEFIHTPLDPSALIPGHDEYLQSKFDSAKEYSKNVSENDGESQKKKRSVPEDMKLKDEVEDERKGKPTFYIPWKNALENPSSIDTKILTESRSIENSDPPTKFEQAANILKGLMTHPSLLEGVLPSKKNVPESTESLENKSLARGQFVKSEERSLGDKINDEQVTQNTNISNSGNIGEGKKYDNDTISDEKSDSAIENSDTDQGALTRNHTETENSLGDSNLVISNKTVVTGENSDDVQNLDSNSTLQSQAGTATSDLVQPSIKGSEIVPQIVNASLGLEKDNPAQDVELAINSSQNETFSSATKYHSIQLQAKDNKTVETDLPIDNVGPNLLNSQIADKNIVPSNQRLRVPVYTKVPNRQQNGTTRGIVSITNDSEPNDESDSQNKRRLPWSPPPSRESQNNAFSSETVRTRIQVPFLNYERRNKSQFTSSPTKPEIITSNARVSSSTRKAQSYESIIGNVRDQDFSEDVDRPYTVEETSDHTKKNSDSHIGMMARKIDYYPRKHTVKNPNNSNLERVDDSELSRSSDRSLQLDHTRDIYSTTIPDNGQSGFSKISAGRELPGYLHDSHPKPDPGNRYGSLSRIFDNHSQSSLPPTSETSHPFIQRFPSGQGRSLGGHEPGQITSSVTFSSPQVDHILSQHSKSFEDDFGKSQQDSSRHLDSTSSFPSPNESQFTSSLETNHHRDFFNIPNYSKDHNNSFKGDLISGTSSKAIPSSTETSTETKSEYISKPPSKNNTNVSAVGQTISLFVPPNFTPNVEKFEPLPLTTSFNFNPYNVPVTPSGSNEGVNPLSSTSLRGGIDKNGDPSVSPTQEVTGLPPNKTLLNSSFLKEQDISKPVNSFRTKLQNQRTLISSPLSQKSLTTSSQVEPLLASPEIKTDSLNSSRHPVFLQTLSNQPIKQNLKNSTADKSAESNTNSQNSSNNSAPQPEQGSQEVQHQSRNRGIVSQSLRQRMNRRGNSQSRNVPVSSTTAPVHSEARGRNDSRQSQKSLTKLTNLMNNQQRRTRNRQPARSQRHPVSHQPTRTSRNQNPSILQETPTNESASQKNQPTTTHRNRISASRLTATENHPARTHSTHRISQDISPTGSTATQNQSGRLHPNRRFSQEISATGSTATVNQPIRTHHNERISQAVSATGSTTTENQPVRAHHNERISQAVSATGSITTENQPARTHHNERVSQEIPATGSSSTENQPARTHQNHRVSPKISPTRSTFTNNQSARTQQSRRGPQHTSSVKKSNSNEASYSPRHTHLNTNPTSHPTPSVPTTSTVSSVIENFAEESLALNPADDSLILPGFWEPQKNGS